jgi:putative proton-coupled thiamine transporter YuaJ
MTLDQWFQQAFKKFGEINLPTAIILITLVALGVGVLVMSGKKAKWTTHMLTCAALAIALAFVLSMIRLYKMPQGGSISAAGKLPIILFAYAFGAAPGITAGVVFGMIDFINSSSPITNIWSFLLDYSVAFGLLGLSGLFGKMKNQSIALPVGIIVACTARFIASVMSGVMFYAAYAEGTGMSPLVYSITYNGSYMLPDMLICILVGLLAGKRVVKIMKGSR